jgi:hypothetical protein
MFYRLTYTEIEKSGDDTKYLGFMTTFELNILNLYSEILWTHLR